ncbi:MAG: gluconolactonase, partial [Clostridia bacterium]|nr:gluconolactonase [Clostridia bacterium]
MKKRFLVMLVALLLAMSVTVQASEPFYSYTYSYQNGVATDVAAPVAYEENGVFRDTETGCAIVTPEDIIVDAAGNVYVVDSGANCVFVLDSTFVLQRTITGYTNAAGETVTFNKPTGLFADSDGLLYIADTANKRVVVLDGQDNLVRTVEQPESDLLDKTFSFEPEKLVVDESGRMFVLVQNVNKGLMQFSPDGDFVGYIGSNNVVYTVMDLVWKTLMNAEQRAQL